MNYEKLDNDELLVLALAAINGGRDAEALLLLKTLLEREPGQVHARYLLAAQYAQMGLMDRAEAGFRAVVAAAPQLAIARFQLGQLLLGKGDADQAAAVLAPLSGGDDALAAYARGLSALVGEDSVAAARELRAGLALAQPVPALAADMQRLLDGIAAPADTIAPLAAAAPRFLSSYGYEG